MEAKILPRIAITMGDPSGIGPEIIVKYFIAKNWKNVCHPIIIGSLSALIREMKSLNASVKFNLCETGERKLVKPEGISVVQGSIELTDKDMLYGHLSRRGAEAVVDWIRIAVSMALRGEVDAICTAPINKTILKEKASFPYPGHTEFLAAETKRKSYVMMLAGPKLRVSLVTIHCPLSSVAGLLTVELIKRTIAITDQGLKTDFGIKHPKLAVAGLNPHAGENGKFGKEEIEIIRPAIDKCRRKNIDVYGPFPPDTIYFRTFKGEFDAVISMYHDQGLIPLKLVHFYDGVNITLGLPIIRTSVDHGTAYDIAGRGIAQSKSLEEAISLAAFMARNRLNNIPKEFVCCRSKNENYCQ